MRMLEPLVFLVLLNRPAGADGARAGPWLPAPAETLL